jgi:para-aminobenzoate synthetase/4-amino-4-deoxychorismate lyase
MLATRALGIAHRARHRGRLAASAAALGFEFEPAAFDAIVERALAELSPGGDGNDPWRVRVSLRHDGRLAFAHAPLPPLAGATRKGVRVLLAEEPLAGARPLAGHKTSARAVYDAGIRAAEAEGAFDTLFFGPEGELLEGGRSSVFVRLGRRWYTPPLADGVLPGVMRAVLLADPRWGASERRLTRADVIAAEGLVVCNALRGALAATIDQRHSLAA